MVKRAAKPKVSKVPTLALHKIKPKNKNWKSQVKIRYVKTKRYVQGTRQRKVTTGIMESESKQYRFNIWSEKALKVPELEENQIYTISNVEKDQNGIFNFGESSRIEKTTNVQMEEEEEPVNTINNLASLNEERMIDFQGHIQTMDLPFDWMNKQNGKTFTKQTMTVVDVLSRTSIKVTLWENFVTQNIVGEMYRFNGFRLKIYKDSRAVTSTVYSKFTHLVDLDIQPVILRNIEFKSLSHTYIDRKLAEVETLLEGKEDFEILYTRTPIRIKECLNETPFYLGCSQCSSKLEDSKYCHKCEKTVKPIVRLLFTFAIHDGSSSIIVKLFHKASERLLQLGGINLKATDLEAMGSESALEELSKLVDLKLKVGFSSNVATYNEEKYNKHIVFELFLD